MHDIAIRLLGAALRLVDRMLQVVLRPRPERVCFLSIPDYTDNAYYAYRHALLTRSGLEFVWLLGETSNADRIRADFETAMATRPDAGHQLTIERRHSLRGYLLYLRSRYVFHSHGAYAFSRTAPRRDVVNLWHGMPIKAIGHLNTRSPNAKKPFGTMQVATSETFRGIIARAFRADPDDVLLTGLPRCDALHLPEARATSPEQVRSALSIPAGHRLVLWMPTYRAQEVSRYVHSSTSRDGGSQQGRTFLDDLPDWALPALSQAAKANDCTVVVKLHPFDVLNTQPAAIEHDNIRVLAAADLLDTGIQLYDVLAATDGLLSDLSSVIIDFALTGRPIGLLGYSEDTYDRDLLLPMELFLDSDRFHALSGPDELDRFMRDVRGGRTIEPAGDEVMEVIGTAAPEPASEVVLAAVGL